MSTLDELGSIASDIEDLKAQLDDVYEIRAEQILEALGEGYSLRAIGEALGISHTAVAKAIADV